MSSIRQRNPLTSQESRMNMHYGDAAEKDSELDDSQTSSLTIRWEEVPEWMQDNEYITAGYRRSEFLSFSRSFLWKCLARP